MKESTKEWLAEKIPGGGFISDITGAIETNLAKASRFILFVDLGYAGYRAVTHSAGTKDNTLDAIWLVSQILAFDLSSPGLERIAREAEARGDKGTAIKTRITKWAGIVLGSLTFVEMGLIQLGWLPDYLPAFSFILMVLRGVASVLVLNFTGIDQHTPAIETLPTPAPSTQPATQNADDLAAALQKIKDELAQQIETGMKQLAQEQADKLQIIAANVLSHVRITEDNRSNQSGQSDHLLAGPSDQKAAMSSANSERTADMEQRPTDEKAANEPNKLELTMQFLREHSGRANDDDIDAQIAPVLGLKRPASARFWRLKAIEMMNAAEAQEAASAASEQGAYSKLLAYVQAHQPATQKEIAAQLSISERTVRRNLTAMRKSGQLPAIWLEDRTADSGQDIEGKADIEAAMSSLENRPKGQRTKPMSVEDNDREADRTEDNRVRLRVVR